jgi:hypothetical protein
MVNNIDRVKLPIRQMELSGNPASSHPVAEQEELEKGITNFALEIICFILLRMF